MASPEMRQSARVRKVTAELLRLAGHLWADLDPEGARQEAAQVAERLISGEQNRVEVWREPPLHEVMHRHGLSRSAGYRLLERHAPKDEHDRYYLDQSARDAIHEEVSVRRGREAMLKLLMEGQLIERMGPKTESAARRWLQRHWRPERERLVRMPARRYDVRTAEELEAAVAAIEAAHPGLVVRRAEG